MQFLSQQNVMNIENISIWCKFHFECILSLFFTFFTFLFPKNKTSFKFFEEIICNSVIKSANPNFILQTNRNLKIEKKYSFIAFDNLLPVRQEEKITALKLNCHKRTENIKRTYVINNRDHVFHFSHSKIRTEQF